TGRLGVDLGVFGAPETYLLDEKGMIRFKHVGVIDQRVWSEKFSPVMASLRKQMN
ncbi:MAG: cytochrome c biogenesis protein CcmG/thiol:disulfide interchange protein DsbE, partial [Cellvibrionaceae bacterium]